MGNRIGKLFGSTSKSHDIQQISNKPKDETKEIPKLASVNVSKSEAVTSTAPSSVIDNKTVPAEITPLSQSNVAKQSRIAPVSSETIVEETVSTSEDADLPAFLYVFLKEIVEKEGFTDYSFDVTEGSKHGDGFLAIVKRVTISGVRNGVKDTLILICKLMPTSKARREQFDSDSVFIREAFMYSKVLPTFEAFQREKGLSIEDGFCEYPKCYGTLDDKENDRFVIVLEDLKVTGYQMFDKLKSADFNHVKLFAASLGKLHAVSFALKDQRPEVFAKFRDLKDVFAQQVNEKPEMLQMFGYFFDKAIAAFKPEDEVEIKALTKLKDNVVEELTKTASGERSEPFSVVNHGDCWNNNLMYCYDKENNLPVNISLLDYQISRYSSPALDLVYFFFTSTDKTLRDAHYQDLIQLYHKSLSTNITKLGSDANKLFSYNDLQDQLKNFGRYGLIIAPMLLNIITAKPDDIPDLDNLAEDMVDSSKTFEDGLKAFSGNDASIDKFNERIRDVVRDIIQLGYY